MLPISPLGRAFDGKCLQFVVLKVSTEASIEAETVWYLCIADFLNEHTNLHIPLAVITVLSNMYYILVQTSKPVTT